MARSGVTPYSSCAPRGAGRKPVSISSKSSTMPWRRVSSRSLRTNSAGWSEGCLLCTGSTTTAAMSPALRAIASRALSLP